MRRSATTLRLGFLPVNDCAPLVVAQELGIFKRYGLSVQLHRRTDWKTIHDLIVSKQLDAAHAPSVLPFLMQLGLIDEGCRCVTGMILSLEGNAITISNDLWKSGVCDAERLRERITRERGRRTYTFGVALPLSAQYYLLCEWLRSAGMIPAVRIIQVPPLQMFPLLKLGYLDGYCAEEPWTSLAAEAGIGRSVATSSSLAPLHPEKVLLVREDFAEKRAAEHELLLAALLEACAFCDVPKNRLEVARILAAKHYVDAPFECIRAGLVGPRNVAFNSPQHPSPASIFSQNDPTSARADWITGQLYRFSRWTKRPTSIDHVFRRQAYLRGRSLAMHNLGLDVDSKRKSAA